MADRVPVETWHIVCDIDDIETFMTVAFMETNRFYIHMIFLFDQLLFEFFL